MNTIPFASAPSVEPRFDLKSALLSMERTLIHSALIACDWNQRKAAAALGVRPTTLSQKMQRLNLRPLTNRWVRSGTVAPFGSSRV